jgi:di/tricarboxylate transporter
MPYQMFDFTPVGLAVAVAGLGFIALVGWRLVPRRADAFSGSAQQFSFMAELRVLDGSPTVGQPFVDLDERAEQADVLLVGLIRKGQHYHALARTMTMEADDLVVVQGSTDGLAEFIKTAGLQETDQQKPGQKGDKETDEAKPANDQEKFHTPEIIECVVRAESRLAGRSIFSFGLRKRFDITVLGISRAGIMWREEVRHRTIEAGDVLLLTGAGTASAATLDLLGLITINRTSVAPFRTRNIVLTVGIFMVAIALASAGLVSFTIAIAGAVAAYALLGFVPAREFYQQIEWPVVVMLACLLPIGAAFDKVGGTALVAGSIVNLTYGYSPVVALVAIMIVTMTLSDVLNNVATMVITGPIAIDMALRLDVNPDTFLMGTAIASSCAFLTPIGHKNNTLIMGPGSYRFADYWRMGLPLEMVVLAVAVPMLLIVWPL